MSIDQPDLPTTNLIEKDSPVATLVLLGVIVLLVLGSGLALAYLGGVFTGKDAVAANDKRITAEALLAPAPHAKP